MESPLPARRLTELALSALLCLAAGGLLLAGSSPAGVQMREDRLRACDAAMTGARFAVQSAPVRARTAAECGDLAAAVLQDAPSHGLAHLVGAMAALAADDRLEAVEHLTSSRRFAPWEGWLAERRFLLIQGFGPAAQERLLPAEVAVLLTTDSGVALLAGSLAEPGVLQQVALTAAERASPADRRRFLNVLRKRGAGA